MRIPARFATPLLAVPCLLVWPDVAGAQQFAGAQQVAGAQQSDTLNYSIAIDCEHGAMRGEGTQTAYEIVGVSASGEEFSFTPDSTDMRRLTGGDCRRGVAPFTTLEAVPDSVRIRRFRIGLIGGLARQDALFLDSLQLTLGGPSVADSLAWDVDGGKGWCISHDPGDADGRWRHWTYDGRCYPCLEFSVLPRVEGDSIIDGDWKETAAPGYGECPAPGEALP